MAVKEARPSNSEWRDPMHWRDRVPLEIRIHQRVDRNRPPGGGRGHDSLIEHRGYRLMMKQRRFRIYLKYYEGGDLDTACEDNFFLRSQDSHFHMYPGLNNFDLVHLPEDGTVPPILSEGFIWWIFRSLVNACQVLHSGQVLNVDGSNPDWQPITHLDIRPSNIFLQPRPHRDDGTQQVSNAAPLLYCSLAACLSGTVVPSCCPV